MKRGVWKLPDLWTHRTRRQGPWKPHRTRFPQLPHASMCLNPSQTSVTYVAGQICYPGRRPVKLSTLNSHLSLSALNCQLTTFKSHTRTLRGAIELARLL